jgi:hypothetical protein
LIKYYLWGINEGILLHLEGVPATQDDEVQFQPTCQSAEDEQQTADQTVRALIK